MWKHVFRNAMLLVIAGFPATFISMFFTGSLLIEVMFSLNGLGLLGYEATVSRLSGDVWHTLYFHPDWPAAEYHQRYQLYAGRSPNRF
jgi:microcin C transport system permease protein